jgi:hypothetical protein
MATRKQLEKKKKAREQKGRARVAAQRHKMQILKKGERRQAMLDKKFREKIVPFIKDPEKRKAMEEVEAKKSRQKIEKNLEILKALEDEYLKEKEMKKTLNETLEAEGHVTLKDKINALEDKARCSMTESEAQSGQIDLSKND